MVYCSIFAAGQGIAPPAEDHYVPVSAFNSASMKGWLFQLAAVVLLIVSVATNDTIATSRPDMSLTDISSEAITWSNISSFVHAVLIFAAKFVISKTQLTIIGADLVLALLFTIGSDLQNSAIQGPYRKESRHASVEMLRSTQAWTNEQGQPVTPTCLDSLLGRKLEPRVPSATAGGEFHNPLSLNQSTSRPRRQSMHRSSGTIGNWEERFSSQHNRRYWVNTVTSETTWNQPAPSRGYRVSSSADMPVKREGTTPQQQYGTQGPVTTTAVELHTVESRREQGPRFGVGHDEHVSAVRSGGQQWMQKYSEAHGRPFWYNIRTGERTWRDPNTSGSAANGGVRAGATSVHGSGLAREHHK